MRVLSVVGARPQFVKAAPVSRALRAGHEEILVHTGQHYDATMSADFFRELEMPAPDVELAVGSGSHAAMTGAIMRRLEPVLDDRRPDVVLVYGDTNSTLAAALVAAKARFADGRRPWTAHVEAGLRSFNRAMPEERNRVVTDHLAELLLAPTTAAVANLAREGLSRRARLVGDVMVDGFAWASHRPAAPPAIAAELPGYLLLTLHRAENVDDPQRLRAWIEAFRIERPVVFPVHPRTRAVLARERIRLPGNVHPIEPVGYLAMLALERGATAIATDSGGVQKEAYLAGVPCLTLRSETEWIETVEAGWNRIVGDSVVHLHAALRDEEFMARDRERPPLFGDGAAAERIVAALEAHSS